ncbi:MAG: GntR family transcriptional regulator [Actinomycetota bacterium]|nr:GntR family transcriptional regulator [Actinomycetota bacterium]
MTTLLDVSRGTVRSILIRLVQDGYLTSEPHRGVRTRSFTVEEALSVMEARETLESALAEKAAERATDAELEMLAGICEEMGAPAYVDSEAEYARLNRRFHQQIRDSTCGRSCRVSPARSPSVVMRQCCGLTHTSPRQTALIEHRAILAALQTRNPEDHVKAATKRDTVCSCG